jgi:predicted phosphoadenosine phosphosulfate sulfurtransferase
MSESKSSLNLYRVIDPHVWARLCSRVGGANFVATYGKQISYRSFTLPNGHTWKSYAKFLLDTLPKEVSENFKKRFAQSIKVWGRVGRGLKREIIEDLERNKIPFKRNGCTRHGSQTLERIRIVDYPDHLDMLKCHNSEVASWKRLVLTILKNDHTCKYLGLAPTKEQAERQKYIQQKYKNIGKKEKK